MSVALTGYRDDPDDPLVIVPGALVDQPLLHGPVSQSRREDMQVARLIENAAASGSHHPIEVSVGEDPPDRYWAAEGTQWGLELTELTLEDVRADYAPARRLGRELQGSLRESPDHAHLRGRVVVVSHAPTGGGKLPRDTSKLEGDLFDALREDRGVVGEALDPAEGLPEKLPLDRGFYGEIGPVSVQTNDHGPPGWILVSVSVQAELLESEALAGLYRRVGVKDTQPNEVLLATCGLPDEHGYTCPIEDYIFELILEAKRRGKLAPPEPSVLRGVALQRFGDGSLIEIYRQSGCVLPWAEPSRA